MRLKRGSESKIKCDSVGGVQPDALFMSDVVQEIEPIQMLLSSAHFLLSGGIFYTLMFSVKSYLNNVTKAI